MSFINNFLASWREYRRPGYYEEFDYAWTMSIDLDRCTGCEACVTACQAENNLPIVGEDEFAKGREMQWIRIERYWEGEYPNVKLGFIPMLCQHCDAAPCETVCPVGATYHNQDGLNAQVYNRCIGTRSCAVYCPYEVRYFNYNDHHWDAPLDEQLNPDVSVREKGVMEKCTFCIQRIRQAKDQAKDDGRRRVRDGEVQPACVQTCPAEALVFGDRNDAESQVSQSMNDPRAYHVLEELNTDPSVVYLKKVDSNAA
ncbi:MAG: 4Fe-4S dicluster domain-containing protein [Pseudomonadota bacterium]|mgnify:FL=1|jgi:molybdopterin-containing oxidoreductase family iron-sulfur binding subunit|nr:4Fe-4S dicluster domain-containing protein [Pseudomonadota bacterium]